MKGDYFQDEKLNYEDIEVPDELLFMVRRTVAADRKKKAAVRRRRILKTAASVAAVWFLCLTIGVNSSYAFAEAAVKIPVVKDMAQAVVIRSYRPEIAAVYEEHKTGWRTEKEPEEVSEKQAEAALAENENNNLQVLADTAGQEISEQTEDKTPQGPDGWKAEMTSEKLRGVTELYTPEMEEMYADAPEKLRTILLAELADKDIALYGYHEDGAEAGVALRVGDTHQYFDWHYMIEGGKLPEITCKDMDGDRAEEILVFLYNGEISENEAVNEEIPEQQKKEDAVQEKTAEEKEESAQERVLEKKDGSTQGAESEKKGGSTQDKTTEKKDGSIQEKVQGNAAANSSDISEEVSGNDVTETSVPASENKTEESAENKVKPEAKPETEPEKPAGELWVVFLTGDNWSASLLSSDDYKIK